MKFISAAEANSHIMAVLKSSSGGSAVYQEGEILKSLSHYPLRDRPATMLPWPFNKLQPYTIQYRVARGDTTLDLRRFPWKDVNKAISIFLKDIESDDLITIAYL